MHWVSAFINLNLILLKVNESISDIHLNLVKILKEHTHNNNDSSSMFNYTRNDIELMNEIVLVNIYFTLLPSFIYYFVCLFIFIRFL